MPTARVRQALAAFWFWFAHDNNDDPGAFQVLTARLIYVALVVVVVVTATAFLVAVIAPILILFIAAALPSIVFGR